MLIYILITAIIIFIALCMKDILNYLYARRIFKLLLENKVLTSVYTGLNVTKLGVLYYWQKVAAGSPEEYHGEYIGTQMAMLDETFLTMNVDGIIRMDYMMVANHEKTNDFMYLIKFIPILRRFNMRNFIYCLLISIVINLIIYRFGFMHYMIDFLKFLIYGK